jgi:hypothetical protein
VRLLPCGYFGATVEGVGSVLRRSSVPMRVGRDSPEQIRRREVSRALKKINLSPE